MGKKSSSAPGLDRPLHLTLVLVAGVDRGGATVGALAQLGQASEDHGASPGGPLPLFHDVELVGVELGQQRQHLAHGQLVVVLDGEEVVVGPGVVVRVGRGGATVGALAQLGQASEDHGTSPGGPLPLFHDVELVGVELGQQRQHLAHGQLVVVLDGEEVVVGPGLDRPVRLTLVLAAGKGCGAGLIHGTGLAQFGDPVDDRHPAPAGPLASLDHVELVGVELGQQRHDLAHGQLVVVLDGKHVVVFLAHGR